MSLDTSGARDADKPLDVLVIGAGWAGLSAAVHARRLGLAVGVLEAAPQAGGRARGQTLELAGQACRLDNGQHLLVGAYRECLSLIDALTAPAAPPPSAIGSARHSDATPGPYTRHPMRLESPDGLLMQPWRLPAPFDLAGAVLGAQGLDWSMRLALLRAIGGLRWRGWTLPADLTVADWFDQARQPEDLIRRFWEPLCVATLNTRPEEAAAQTFATVLRDTLGADARACEFVLPRGSLEDLLPGPALAWLAAQGATVRLRHPVRQLTRPAAGAAAWQVGEFRADHVILAIPAHNGARLLDDSGHPGPAERLHGFDYEPIVTVYVAWAAGQVSLPPWRMLAEEPEQHAHGQWLFDRGRHGDRHIAAVVISARGRQWLAAGAEQDRLIAAIGAQLVRQLRLPPALDARAIVEKRATFKATPQRPRLDVDSLGDDLPGLWLAGDHVWPSYPATLEAAVRSGRRAAEQIHAATRAGDASRRPPPSV